MRRAQAAAWIVGGSLAGAGVLLFFGLAATAPAVAEPMVVAQSEAPAAGVAAVVRRRPARVRIYRSSPGPYSVRQCEAHYVQEFREAGTVIVPRVHCWWEG
ncbi:MAG: hypothetical protein ACLP1D_17060 [Xanthobacteraceae bacterium]|jgi:hypothetical protein